MTTPLGERNATILRSVVHLHVDSGEPVGSESLARHLNRTLSPASIRNTMAELERLGYLGHPHTSAGRVPTDEGYRVYVDSLMEPQPLDADEARLIRRKVRPGEGSTLGLMESASQALSTLSHHVGFALVPDLTRLTFRHIDLVRLPHPRILVVMVSPTGIVTHRLIEIEEDLTQDDLQACANYLNAHFVGMRLSRIRARLVELMGEEKASYDHLLQRVIAISVPTFEPIGDEANVFIEGAANLFAHSADIDRMKSIFQAFEEKSRLVRILTECLAGGGLRVTIGKENSDPDLRHLSLVVAPCAVDGDEAFAVGILGSTRMEYARAIALVATTARAVEACIDEIRS